MNCSKPLYHMVVFLMAGKIFFIDGTFEMSHNSHISQVSCEQALLFFEYFFGCLSFSINFLMLPISNVFF